MEDYRMKLTVKEYASSFKITVQAVYQKLNKGTLKSIEENGKKYIIVEQADKQLEQVSTNQIKVDNSSYIGTFFKKEIKKLNKQLNAKDKKVEQLEKKLNKKEKEIKKLNKLLVQSNHNEKETLLKFISEMKHQIEYKKDDIVDINIKKKKSKKKKKR